MSSRSPLRTRPCSVALFLATGIAAGAIASCHAQPSPMHRVVLSDPAFNMPAISLMIPAGWTFEGTILRNVVCSPGDPFPVFRATAPDGITSVEMDSPFFTFYPQTGLSADGCGVVAPAMPAGRILSQYVLPQIRPQAQRSEAEPTPDRQQYLQSVSSENSSVRTSGDAARVRVSYLSKKGVPVEEYFMAYTQITEFTGSVHGGFSVTRLIMVRAPAGKLQSTVDAVQWAAKLTPDPVWQQREGEREQAATEASERQGEATRAGIAADAQAHMAATQAYTQNSIRNINATGAASQAAARASQNAIDNSAQETAAHMGDRTVANYYWRNQQGNQMMTHTPNPPGPGYILIQNPY